jgi:hypothetical protein
MSNIEHIIAFTRGNYKVGRELEVMDNYDLSELDDYAVEHIAYTLKHKKALIMTYIDLVGHLPSRYSRLYYHDTDKLFLYMYLRDSSLVSKYHLKSSIHHAGNWETEMDKFEAILDYECARFTKEDKPLNAYETILKYNPKSEVELGDLLDKYNLHNLTHNNYTFELFYANQEMLEEELVSNTIRIINWCFNNSVLSIEDLVLEYNNLVKKLVF